MKKSVLLITFLVFILKFSNAQDVFTMSKSAVLRSPVIQEEVIHSEYVNEDFRILIPLQTIDGERFFPYVRLLDSLNYEYFSLNLIFPITALR